MDQIFPSLCVCWPAGLAFSPSACAQPALPSVHRRAELCAVSMQDKERLRRQLKLRAEKEEKEKAEKQRLKEERRKERQEALECVPCPLHLGSHTLCLSHCHLTPPPSTGISTGLGQQVSLSVMSHRAKLEEKRKKEEEKRLREEEKVECVSRSCTFPCV